MNLRLLVILIGMTAAFVNFTWATLTPDQAVKQTRLLYAIYFSLGALTAIVQAIGLKTGALPLWGQ